jgi:uncharacterized HAD superfamily protein
MMSARLERTDYTEKTRQTLEKYNYAVQKRDSDVKKKKKKKTFFILTKLKTDFLSKILPIEFRETSNYTGEEIATGDFKFNPHDVS